MTRKEYLIKYREDNKDKKNEYNQVYYQANKEMYLLNDYKKTDKKRGWVCDLTIEWLKEHITSKHCTYCIDETKNIGCDRIDNDKGHTMDNCVPCCLDCNRTRNNIYSHEEMLIIGQTIRKVKKDRFCLL